MKKSRKLSLLLVVLMIGTLFTGCSKEDKELANAFIKSQEILSLESTNDITLNLSAEGLEEDSQAIFDAIASQINNAKLSVKQKSVTNKEKTVTKAQLDANLILEGMNFASSIWIDADMSGDKLILKETIKLPSTLMSLAFGSADKEYVVLDFDEISQATSEITNMETAMKYQKKLTQVIVDYIKAYNFNLPIVSKLENKTINDEKIQYYQVALDNESFKELFKYSTISILQDENIMNLCEEYMLEHISSWGEVMPGELSVAGKALEMVKDVEVFFESIEDLTILGEDGILITYGINEEGYIVSETSKMNFLIDSKQIMDIITQAVGEEDLFDEMATPIFKLSIEYDNKINKINEDLKIIIPTTTKENSINYMDLIETTPRQ